MDDMVMTTGQALATFGESKLRWMLSRARWQRPHRGVIVTHSGPLTESQRIRAVLLAHGPDAALGGVSAASLDGLTGFPCKYVHVLVPAHRSRRSTSGCVLHRSTYLTEEDVHPIREPRRTRLPRSIVDAASWATSDLESRAVLAAAVQQRLVRPDDLRRVLERIAVVKRRALIVETINDVEGGSQSGYELDFLQMCRKFGLPPPSRQVRRTDSEGRPRYLDAEFDEYDLVVEIDGSQHMEARAWWQDMHRQNETHLAGKTVLRYPGFVVRHQPELPARQILGFMAREDALRDEDCAVNRRDDDG